MLRIHIDEIHPLNVDIYVDISAKDFTNSTPKKDILSPILPNDTLRDYADDTIYECVHEIDHSCRQKKNYTLQQILDNVDSIQKQYEQLMQNPITSTQRVSCFMPLKHLTKMFKNFKFLRHRSQDQPRKTTHFDTKSPFIFGGETLHWIALPQYHDHIYENQLIH
ncbi:unnamed protein product [Adineta ricciae]|uniref:Uncharacterized protein n=1 Tax=Adineta ricciae TaxID=249248 RepID=A0A814X5C3_ADIRI|nr:unnamed protein product [Adineta ricciae]